MQAHLAFLPVGMLTIHTLDGKRIGLSTCPSFPASPLRLIGMEGNELNLASGLVPSIIFHFEPGSGIFFLT